MNYCDRICNQTVISYTQGKYGPQLSNRHSSPDLRPARKQTHGKESTKSWVVRSFYSGKSRILPQSNPSPSAVASPKPSAVAAKDLRESNSAVNVSDNLSKSAPERKTSSDPLKPAIRFEQSLVDSLAKKYEFCLVGKFPGWRPSLAQIRQWVSTKWKLHGRWSVALLDHRHVFISLDNEADMLYVWAKNRWFVNGCLMKVFKWFPTFRPSDGEPSSAAVWVSLPALPLIFFEEQLLFRIGSSLGNVFATDVSTRSLSRPYVARVCVEVDLLKELPRQVWIGIGDQWGHWQDLLYEKLPPYCTNCREQGHSTESCRVGADSKDSSVKLKSSFRNRKSEVRAAGLSQEHFSEKKRVRIGPVIREGDERNSSGSQVIGHDTAASRQKKEKGIVECKGGSVLEGSSQVRAQPEDRSKEGGASRKRDSFFSSIESSEGLNQEKGGGIYASRKEGELPGATNAGLDQEVRWKAFGCRLERKESYPVGDPAPIVTRRKRPLFFWRNKTKPKEAEVVKVIPRNRGPSVIEYKYSDIKKMTKSFTDTLGQGGFGIVYKGELPDGHIVAVKVAKERARYQEFLEEVKIIKDLSHSNIVQLLGFCSERRSTALVYEFMPNGSLDRLIHHSTHPSSSEKLRQIAVGIARGLDYLQHGCDSLILHLDVKPSNILLDNDFRPKISDFGLARRVTDSWQSSGTVTAIRGTYGYVAPELCFLGRFSKKTDVFSYGIMLLEMVLKKKPVNFSSDDTQEKFLIDWVLKKVTTRGGIPNIAWEETDRKMMLVGLWCAQDDPGNRPSFATVIEMLEGNVEDILVPPKSARKLFGDASYSTNGEADGRDEDHEDVASGTDSSLIGR